MGLLMLDSQSQAFYPEVCHFALMTDKLPSF